MGQGKWAYIKTTSTLRFLVNSGYFCYPARSEGTPKQIGASTGVQASWTSSLYPYCFCSFIDNEIRLRTASTSSTVTLTFC